ncbi:MAG: type II toxin-antitoxin system VapC family toxin [Deltaproteobacteria bacterium]|nr:type II toxin-antitoxin system VapC family toxin [Deltaproteobacteria bacterium]
MSYFDSNYLFRLYWEDPGFVEVRACASRFPSLSCAVHGRVEVISTCHRKFREGAASNEQFRLLVQQFQNDCAQSAFTWLPLTSAVFQRVEEAYLHAPASTFLRAADALHLACAREYGFTEIYSNDRHLLAAAPLFALTGVNVIPRS